MGYNYAWAFVEADPELLREASLTALMNYRDSFPEADGIRVTPFIAQQVIRVSSSFGSLVYTFEELGFKV